MEFQGRLSKNGSCGTFPDFGAIFMSNSSTRKECFKRKLFGLPMSAASFVQRVKVGMILFLFEYDKRELYGVFKATTDGELNIIPYAYSSSGKKFPAQVRFTSIWHCHPLQEHEFKDAIRHNYFATGKFNFGLSKDQVQRLLWLFGSRKIGQFLSQSFPDAEAVKRYRESSPEKREMERCWSKSNHTKIARKKLKRDTDSASFSNRVPQSYSDIWTMVKDESELLDSADSHIASKESVSMHYTFSSYGPDGPCSQSSLAFVAGHSSASEHELGPHPDHAIKSQPASVGQEIKELETSGNLDILGDYIPLLPLSDDSESDGRASPELECYKTDQIDVPVSASGPCEDTCQPPVFAASPITEVGDVRIKENAYGSKSPSENCQGNDDSYGDNRYKSVRGLYSDAPGNEGSVFSRLNFSSRLQDKEDDIRKKKLAHSTHEKKCSADVDKPAQEIMEELQQMHDGWKKTVRMNRSLVRRDEHNVNRKTCVFSRLSRTSGPDAQDNDMHTRSKEKHDNRQRKMGETKRAVSGGKKSSVFSRLSRTWEHDVHNNGASPSLLPERHGKQQKVGSSHVVSSVYCGNEEISKSLTISDSGGIEVIDNKGKYERYEAGSETKWRCSAGW